MKAAVINATGDKFEIEEVHIGPGRTRSSGTGKSIRLVPQRPAPRAE